MAKKKGGFAKFVIGAGAVAVAGKVAYSKYKTTKEKYAREENDSVDNEVRKYNAICENKIVEVEDEEFSGCEVKAVGSKTVLDLGLAVFEKDVYINFSSTASKVTIILPEGVNATCDVEKVMSGVRNLVDNVDEEGIHTVYIIGKAVASNVEVIPVNFYVDDDDFEDESLFEDECLFEDESPIKEEEKSSTEATTAEKVIKEVVETEAKIEAEVKADSDTKDETETINIEEVTK